MIDQNRDLKEKLASVIDRATHDAIALWVTFCAFIERTLMCGHVKKLRGDGPNRAIFAPS